MKRFQRIVIPAALTLAMLTGCGAVSGQSGTSTAVVGSTAVVENAAIDTDGLFSQRDLEQSWDESTAVRIELTGDTASSDSDAVQIDGGTVTITSEGVYVLSGTLSNGSIIVDARDEDKVQLVLNGVSVTSSDFAAIYAKNADKVFVTLAENTENTLVNESDFTEIDDNHVDAVIFSKCDLTLNGAGELTVTSPAGHGIVSKDELTITGGIYTITASGHGLTGKDSVAIAAGSFVIDSGKDGIHAEDEDDSEAGFIYLSDGDFTITAQGDGISASGMLEIAGGNYNITTGGGSTASEMKGGDSQLEPGAGQNGAAQGGQPGEPPAQSGQTDSKAPPEKPEEDKNPQIDVNDAEQEKDFTESDEVSSDSTSQKGLKSSTSVIVQAGNFTLDTADVGVHSNGTVTITGGEWTIRTGDDGIHADGALTITGGSFSIPYCYEGIEGSTITINGGTFDITANDDGLNAADGTSNAPGMANENCWIEINDGEFTIVSDGDSIDSNGDLTIMGGTVVVWTANTADDQPLDADGTLTVSGGTVLAAGGSAGMGVPISAAPLPKEQIFSACA